MAEHETQSMNALTVVPLYRQLRKLLQDDIVSGKWDVGDKLPSEAELCRLYNVSRITVRAALAELVEEKMLQKVQGKGTFVAMNKSKSLLTFNVPSFTEFCRQNGLTPKRIQLTKQLVPANDRDIAQLGAKAGEKIVCLARVFVVDGTPLALSEDRLRERFSFLMDEDMERHSLNELMSTKGSAGKLSFVGRTIEVCSATLAEAEHLKTAVGGPLLMVRDMALAESGEPVRRTKELFVGDRVRIAYN